MRSSALLQDRPYNDHLPMAKKMVAHRRGVATDEGSAEIGERLAALRKERGISQIEMAELLGVSQPVISEYERGTVRLHGELIVRLTQILRVSADEILGLEKESARGPRDRAVARRLRDIDRLPKRDRDALVRTIDAFLARARPE